MKYLACSILFTAAFTVGCTPTRTLVVHRYNNYQYREPSRPVTVYRTVPAPAPAPAPESPSYTVPGLPTRLDENGKPLER